MFHHVLGIDTRAGLSLKKVHGVAAGKTATKPNRLIKTRASTTAIKGMLLGRNICSSRMMATSKID
jgi:hypothetical protein